MITPKTPSSDPAGQHPIAEVVRDAYGFGMVGKTFPGAKQAGLALGVLLLLATAGCSDSPAWGGWSNHPTLARLQASRGVQRNWVYYPTYETYYSSNYQEYVYRLTFFSGQTAWVTSAEPMAPVTPEMLQATPAVDMQFHDSPSSHHAEIAKAFPKDWRQSVTGLASTPGN